MSDTADDPLELAVVRDWLRALEARHLANLTLPEVTRALRALSSVYVERRQTVARGAALNSAGKRAAFALVYAPLHFITTWKVVRALDAATPAPRAIVDLGCGTGVTGAAWAINVLGSGFAVRGSEDPAPGSGFAVRGSEDPAPGPGFAVRGSEDSVPGSRFSVPGSEDSVLSSGFPGPTVIGIDHHPWALGESRWTYQQLRVNGRVRRGNAADTLLRRGEEAVLAAYVLNELADDDRQRLIRQLLNAVERGVRILVLEPISRRIAPWWNETARSVVLRGGRADEWEFAVDLPPLVSQLDSAAGLDHRVIKVRTFYSAGTARSAAAGG